MAAVIFSFLLLICSAEKIIGLTTQDDSVPFCCFHFFQGQNLLFIECLDPVIIHEQINMELMSNTMLIFIQPYLPSLDDIALSHHLSRAKNIMKDSIHSSHEQL